MFDLVIEFKTFRNFEAVFMRSFKFFIVFQRQKYFFSDHFSLVLSVHKFNASVFHNFGLGIVIHFNFIILSINFIFETIEKNVQFSPFYIAHRGDLL